MAAFALSYSVNSLYMISSTLPQSRSTKTQKLSKISFMLVALLFLSKEHTKPSFSLAVERRETMYKSLLLLSATSLISPQTISFEIQNFSKMNSCLSLLLFSQKIVRADACSLAFERRE
jgi:hypothetical protein